MTADAARWPVAVKSRPRPRYGCARRSPTWRRTLAWLALAGASARPIHGSSVPAKRDGILVELLPERLPPIEWNGPRVSCIPDGPDKPQWSLSEIHVTSHLRHSIVEAVALAQRERPSAELPATEADGDDGHGGSEYRPDAGLRRLGCGCWWPRTIRSTGICWCASEELGCEVTLCADGVETLARWSADEFDVLVTDMNMPLMNGYELVRTLRARSTNAPIIGLTADALQTQRDAGFAAGLNAWVVKPVDLRTLHDALSTACARIIGSNSPDRRRRPSPRSSSTAICARPSIPPCARTWRRCGRPWPRDAPAAVATLHRMRGSLAVMNAEDIARFCGVLEQKIAEEGMTAMLENAVKSTLAQLTERFTEL